EKRVLMVFIATALLWMTRSIPIDGVNHGWTALLERGLTAAGIWVFRADHINDATIAVGMATLLFMIPAGRRGSLGRTPADAKTTLEAVEGMDASCARDYLMNWKTALRLPWGILLLFGGGFSIAEGFQSSGLSVWCGEVFAGIGTVGPVLLILVTCLMMTFLTEITSNTATTQVMLPILARVALAMEINPLMLMLPATLSASCAFMLPVATPPNAIVFGSGHIEMKHMVRSGIIINLIGVLLITATYFWIVHPVLGLGSP
ncbi:MAG: SLC13 family permease, partial [Phycisphaerae bacterium]